MATAKQLAARKLFVARVRAGEFAKGKKKPRKKNPTARGITTKNAASRPSQATGKKPTKRLVVRRKATVRAPQGYYANPKRGKSAAKIVNGYRVQTPNAIGGNRYIAFFTKKSGAVEYAQLLADTTGKQFAVVPHKFVANISEHAD